MNKNTKENNLYYEELSKIIEQELYLREQDEIVVHFSKREWENALNIISSEMREFQEDTTKKYFAMKILKEIEKKYPRIKEEYHGSKYLPIFQTRDKKAYNRYKEVIYNLGNVGEIIEVEELPIDRVHIFTNGIIHPLFKSAIMELLSNNNPYSINIYSPQKEELIVKTSKFKGKR